MANLGQQEGLNACLREEQRLPCLTHTYTAPVRLFVGYAKVFIYSFCLLHVFPLSAGHSLEKDCRLRLVWPWLLSKVCVGLGI